MQQAQALSETNTAPRAVAGQFEDADDDGEVIASTPKTTTVAMPSTSKTHSLSDALKTSSASTSSPPSLQRRLSSTTNEATKALLAFAAAAGTVPAVDTQQPGKNKKKKTFVVRLEEIKEYRARHGRVPRRDPVASDEPWEGNLLAWVQECRKQFVDGTFSPEKAKALHDLGCEGFRTGLSEDAASKGFGAPTPAAAAHHHHHPALRALMIKRQQQDVHLLGLRRASLGLAMASRRASLDTDGGAAPEEDAYPGDAAASDYSGLSDSQLQEMQLHEASMQSQRLALEEMHARENILAREALLREQMLREQRIAQAMASQRRLSMGAAFGGGGGGPQGLLPPQSSQGRIMSLLQPLESVPSRATDPIMTSFGAASDPRLSALLQAQLIQRRASLQQAHEELLLRRPSDASSHVVERRPSEIGSASALPLEMGVVRKTWEERINEMIKFFRMHGHIEVPPRGEYQDLAHWLATTRSLLREGLLPAPMAKEFLEMAAWSVEPPTEGLRRDSSAVSTPPTQTKLKKIARPVPSPKGKNKRALPKSWHQSFTELQAFKEKFGHCDVKMIVNSPYALLGKWLASQRSRHKLGQLPVDKVTRLRELGCSGFEKGGKLPMRSMFADADEAEFDRAVRRLKEMESGSGDEDDDGTDAPNSPTREKRVRHSYETRVEHIKAFKEKHGHVKIRLGSNDKHEELLARWLASARSRYRGGQFKEERAAELRALGCDGFDGAGEGSFTSDMEEDDAESYSRKRDSPARTATPSPPTLPTMETEEAPSEPPAKKQRGAGRRQTFDDMLKELEEYQYVYGVGCSVPKPDGDKGKLGRWLAFQRRQFIAGKLSEERIGKLKGIGRKEFNKSALIVRAAERAAASIHMDQ